MWIGCSQVWKNPMIAHARYKLSGRETTGFCYYGGEVQGSIHGFIIFNEKNNGEEKNNSRTKTN